jgi:hypothetical protein
MPLASFLHSRYWSLPALILLCLAPSYLSSQQYLEPEPGLFARKSHLAYYDQLYDALIESHPSFAVTRTVCIPSFAPEWTVTIEAQLDSTYLVVASTPQSQLGVGLLEDQKLKISRLRKTKILRFQKQIPSEDAKAIQGIFLSMTSQARYADEDWIVFDGETYHFSTSMAGVGIRCGSVSTPKEGTPPARLVSISQTLFKYAKAGKSSDSKALEELRTQVQRFYK